MLGKLKTTAAVSLPRNISCNVRLTQNCVSISLKHLEIYCHNLTLPAENLIKVMSPICNLLNRLTVIIVNLQYLKNINLPQTKSERELSQVGL